MARLKLNFATVTALITAALYAKENWDNRRDADGPPPQLPLSDDEDPLTPYADIEGAPLMSNEEAQTTFRRPRRKSKPRCCVCCGVRCDLICKALGIAVLLYAVYGLFKLAMWMLTPTPTGIEAMPAFSTSLGCSSGPFYYDSSPAKLQYAIPVDEAGVFTVDITGGSVGTLVLAQGDSDEVVVEMVVQSDNQQLLTKVAPTHGQKETEDGRPTSFFALSTPSFLPSASCLRFDITIYIPEHLKELFLTSQPTTQVQFSSDATAVKLDALLIKLLSESSNNLVLPQTGIRAEDTGVSMRGGYLVGSASLSKSVQIDTRNGDAVTKLQVAASDGSDESLAKFLTYTGKGRSDFTVTRSSALRLSSEHDSIGGDLYLTYKEAAYNGRIQVKAKSTTMYNVQSNPKGISWVGSEDGPDSIRVKTIGWVGLYF